MVLDCLDELIGRFSDFSLFFSKHRICNSLVLYRKRRRAKRAWFNAPASPIAIVATGTPPGICIMSRSESTPLGGHEIWRAWLEGLFSSNLNTATSTCNDLDTTAASSACLNMRSGVRWAETTFFFVGHTETGLELGGFLHGSPVGFWPNNGNYLSHFFFNNRSCSSDRDRLWRSITKLEPESPVFRPSSFLLLEFHYCDDIYTRFLLAMKNLVLLIFAALLLISVLVKRPSVFCLSSSL